MPTRACRLDLSDFHVRRSSHGKFSVAGCIAHLSGQLASTAHRRYMELLERDTVPECEKHVLLTPTGGLGADKLEPVGSAEELYKIVAALDDDRRCVPEARPDLGMVQLMPRYETRSGA